MPSKMRASPLTREAPSPVTLDKPTIADVKSWKYECVELQSILANQPVSREAVNSQIRNTSYMNSLLTYMMLHVIEEVLSSLAPNIVHEWAFLRGHGRAIFWICEACVQFIRCPESHRCVKQEATRKWSGRNQKERQTIVCKNVWANLCD